MGRQLPQLQYDTRRIGQAWDLPDFHLPRFMGFRQFRPHILAFQEQTNAVRACEMLCIGQQLGQGGAGPGGDDIERLRGASSIRRLRIVTGSAMRSAAAVRKAHFLAVASIEGHGDPISQHLRQDQARKAGAGAQIGQRSGFWRDEGRKLGGIPEMPPPDILQGAGGNQIMAGVPVLEQAGIGLQPGQCFT